MGAELRGDQQLARNALVVEIQGDNPHFTLAQANLIKVKAVGDSV